MDIQLFATDKELREFPESKTDSNTVLDKTPSPKDINLMASDLPRSHTDLPEVPASLPDCKSKKRKFRRSCRYRSRSKNHTGGHAVIQVNDPLDSIREKQWIVQTTQVAYLDQLVEHSVGQPMVSQPLIGQPVQPVAGPPPPAASPVVGQSGGPFPPLLSLRLQPDLNALARTLSPQALQYVHLSIQIGRNLLN